MAAHHLFLTLFLQYCPYMIADYIENVQSVVTPSLIRVRSILEPYKILYCDICQEKFQYSFSL